MTRSEAYWKMKYIGEKISHKSFYKDQYLEWNENQIKTEHGYDFSYEFYNSEIYIDNWSIYPLTPNT